MSRFRPWLAPLIALGFALLLFAGYKGLRLWQVHTLFEPENIVENFRTMSQLFDALPVQRSGPQRPLEEQPRELPASFNFQGNAIVLNDWIKQTGTTGLLVLADDRIAFEHYYQGNDVHTRAIGWSVSKSFMSLLIGVALEGWGNPRPARSGDPVRPTTQGQWLRRGAPAGCIGNVIGYCLQRGLCRPGR